MFKKLPPNSPFSYLFLTFIAMAGLSYINFLPGVVSALAGGIGLNDAQAGQVVALNGYGGIVGSIAAVFLVQRISWRRAMLIFMALLALFDLSTALVSDYSVMLGWRFLAGVLGGLSVGIAFSVLARLNNPDRAFGLLLFVQFCIGSLVIYLLPAVEAATSAYAVFYMMASFLLLSMVFLLFLPAYPVDNVSAKQSIKLSNLLGNKLWLLLAITCYQIAASAIWAYVGLIGTYADIAADSVNMYIATTGLLGLLGAMLPMISGNRFGRLYWVSAGLFLSMISAMMLVFSHHVSFYIVSMALLFFSWPAVISYLLAVTAQMDGSGRLSTIASVVSSVGMASGPLLASMLIDEGNFSTMLYSCAIIFLLSFFLLLRPVQGNNSAATAVLTS